MTRTILIAAACTVAFAGCASMQDEKAATSQTFNNKSPKVFVRAKCEENRAHIVVDQEPIHFFRSENNNKPFDFSFQLVTPGYSFDTNVKQPVPQGEITCQASGQTMTCHNENAHTGTWKYTIAVTGGKCAVPPLDPQISND